jgi:peptidoglycan/xylan/chitin deacetylase (PgdA/CDA1 family)
VTRRAIYRAASIVGLNRASRAAFRRRLLVVCYHGLCAEAPDVPDVAGLHVPVRLFAAQIRLLLRYYQPVSLDRVRAHFWEGAPLPEAPVLLTFDDGYWTVARYALPLLRQMGIPSVLFPAAGAVEARRWLWTAQLEWQYAREPGFSTLKRSLKALPVAERHRWLATETEGDAPRPECNYSLLDWADLAKELRAGGVAIGSHGMNHEPLTTCAPGELQDELCDSKRLILQRLHVDVDAIAYPNGDCSPAVAAAAQECGYRLGFTTEPRHTHRADDPLALPRIQVGRDDIPPVLAARLAGWLEWLRTL